MLTSLLKLSLTRMKSNFLAAAQSLIAKVTARNILLCCTPYQRNDRGFLFVCFCCCYCCLLFILFVLLFLRIGYIQLTFLKISIHTISDCCTWSERERGRGGRGGRGGE